MSHWRLVNRIDSGSFVMSSCTALQSSPSVANVVSAIFFITEAIHGPPITESLDIVANFTDVQSQVIFKIQREVIRLREVNNQVQDL